MIGWRLFIIFTDIVKASKTTLTGSEANRATGGKFILGEGTIFFTLTIVFGII